LIGDGEMARCRDAEMKTRGVLDFLAGKMGRRRNTKGPFWRASE